MNQIKIGKYIQEKRKEKGITQSELAEKLNISDRAISKWENGICLPDASNMPIICDILGITINDLFSGEKVDMKNNEKKLEENLLEMTQLKEESDKRLLRLEILIGALALIILFTAIGISFLVDMEEWVRGLIIAFGIIIFLISMCFDLRIEQIAGYYECKDCHHKFIPTYNQVFFAQHVNRTRKMRCPKCGKKTWCKKVLK